MLRSRITAVLALSVLALAGTVCAQGARMEHAKAPSRFVAPAQSLPAGIKIIFSNLGPSPTDEYNDSYGYDILGVSNGLGASEQWIAIPFTPAANATVTALAGAIGWMSGTKDVVLNLYSDNGGVPGAVLASGESSNIPDFDTCCQLVEVRVTATSITKGTQYWVGASADDVNAPDFEGVFMSSNEATTAADEAQSGWFSFGNGWPAAAVGGTVP